MCKDRSSNDGSGWCVRVCQDKQKKTMINDRVRGTVVVFTY